MTSVDFEPQPLEAPLNDSAIQSLRQLAEANVHYKRLEQKLAFATQQLTDAAEKLNDRGHEQKRQYTSKVNRLRANDEQEDLDELHKYEDFQSRVESLTKKMDQNIRSVIGDQIWVEELPGTIRQVNVKVGAASQPSQRSTQGPTQQTSETDHRDEDIVLDDQSHMASDPPILTDTPVTLLSAALSAQRDKWNSKTLTEKYAHNNDYTGFYRVVYDARNPGEDAPPIPAPNLWFAEEEGRHRTSAQKTQGDDAGHDEDSDLEIASERIRINCPITLLPFKEPVTSEICGHSYEKSAILEMLKHSREYAPFSPDQLAELGGMPSSQRHRKERRIGVSQVRCPECNVPLTEAQLRPNPVLLRKVNRTLEAERRRREAIASDDEGSDSGNTDGTRNLPLGIGSSPALPLSGRMRLKSEKRSSVIPQTQLPNRSQRMRDSVLDLDEGEDDEEEEDEEEDEDEDEDEDE